MTTVSPITRGCILLLGVLVLSPATPAQSESTGDGSQPDGHESLWDAIESGRTWLNLRYRYEHADLDNFPLRSDASTLRTALGYESGRYQGFRGFVEFESVASVGSQTFNSTVNGEGGRPPIPDPIGAEVNQAYIAYDDVENLDARLGRQDVVYGNSRFIGNVAWRQNYQSFDAVRFIADDLGAVDLDYVFAHRVNRIFGDQSPQGDEVVNSHFLNVHFDAGDVGRVTAYGYLYDHQDTQILRSTTFGARLQGNQALDAVDLGYVLEFAQQTDAFDNPVDIDQQYYLLEASAGFDAFKVLLGLEQLGGSGQVGDKFSTPFATLHKFNGFADVFLNTPNDGLVDQYIAVSAAFDIDGLAGKTAITATYHLFESDAGSVDYGDELDVVLTVPVTDRIDLGFKYSDFQADERFDDTLRYSAWITTRVL